MLYSIKRLSSLVSSKEQAFTSSSSSLLFELYPEYSSFNLISEINNIESYSHTGDDIYICEECSSTQEIIKILHKQNPLPHWTALISKRQCFGRGQYSKNWISQDGNLFLTLLLPNISLFMQPYSTLLLGTMTVHFLRTLGINAYSKWVNDIIINNKKVAGILLEEDYKDIFFGIGINIVSSPVNKELHKESLLEATHLSAEINFEYSVVGIALALRSFYQKIIKSLVQLTPKEHIAYIEETLAYKGKDIVFRDGSITNEGNFKGISEEGALLLSTDERIEEYISGSIIKIL